MSYIINFKHTVYIGHPGLHPEHQEVVYDCVGEFEPQYEDYGGTCDQYTGDKFNLLSISMQGQELAAWGISSEWKEFRASLESSARAEFDRQEAQSEPWYITIHEILVK